MYIFIQYVTIYTVPSKYWGMMFSKFIKCVIWSLLPAANPIKHRKWLQLDYMFITSRWDTVFVLSGYTRLVTFSDLCWHVFWYSSQSWKRRKKHPKGSVRIKQETHRKDPKSNQQRWISGGCSAMWPQPEGWAVMWPWLKEREDFFYPVNS